MSAPTLDLPRVSVRWRSDQDVARWLVDTWHKGFGDGNVLADTLCKPLGNAGLTFAGDVDELLRALRSGPSGIGDGAGWLTQGSWCAHLSEFGQSREVWLGSYGKVSAYEASGHGFTPNRTCEAYAAFVAAWEAQQPAQPVQPMAAPEPSSFSVGSRVRLTPKFLTSTGQRGTDEAKRIWKVQTCSCNMCTGQGFVAVDERRDTAFNLKYYKDDPEYCDLLRKHPYRHINVKNLKAVK